MPFPTPTISAYAAANKSTLYLGPVEEVLEKFRLACFKRGNSPRTIYDQAKALKRLLAILKVPRWVSKEDILEALAKLPSKSMRAHATKAVRKLLAFMGRDDMLKGLKVPTFGPKRWLIPSDEELRRFYEALDRPDAKLALRLLAETGLRKSEVLEARIGDIDWEHMALIPGKATETKKSGIGFFSAKTARTLKEHIAKLPDDRPEAPIFPYRSDIWLRKAFKRAEAKTGIHVTPQVLRVRFSDIMGYHEIPDRYVDIMQGRAPRSVLAKHYTPRSLARLRRMWEKAQRDLGRPLD